MHRVALEVDTPEGRVQIGNADVEIVNGNVQVVVLTILHPVVVQAIQGLRNWEPDIVSIPNTSLDLEKE
jgi:hypothetical protein